MNLQMKPPVVLKEHELAEQLLNPSQVADAEDPWPNLDHPERISS